MAPRFSVAVEADTRSARIVCAHASGLGAESMGTANTNRVVLMLQA